VRRSPSAHLALDTRSHAGDREGDRTRGGARRCGLASCNDEADDQLGWMPGAAEINKLTIHRPLVIGEGDASRTPMRCIGETFGNKRGPSDIAVYPLEGTTLWPRACRAR